MAMRELIKPKGDARYIRGQGDKGDRRR